MGNDSASNNNNTKANRKNGKRNALQQAKYHCRVCARRHPLRTCRKFLAMNIVARIQTVRQHKYCFNCLAHQHSDSSCLSKRGCKHCQKQHHTLLHVNPRLKKDVLGAASPSRASPPSVKASAVEPSTSESSNSRPSSKSALSLSGLLRMNNVIILPTVVVHIQTPKGVTAVRCLLDTGLSVSRVSTKFVDAWGLPSMTLENEAVCPLHVQSINDKTISIDVTLKVSDRLNILTPSDSIPSSVKMSYMNLVLADPEFYLRAGVDIIFGMQVWDQISLPGDITRTGLPTAKSTIFGYVICGSYHR